MNGKKYALLLSFLSWLSVIAANWLQMIGVVEYDGLRSFVHIGIFVIIGAFAGTIGSENKNERRS